MKCPKCNSELYYTKGKTKVGKFLKSVQTGPPIGSIEKVATGFMIQGGAYLLGEVVDLASGTIRCHNCEGSYAESESIAASVVGSSIKDNNTALVVGNNIKSTKNNNTALETDFITCVNSIATREAQLYDSLKFLEINPIILKEKIISKYNIVIPDELLKETTEVHSIVRYIESIKNNNAIFEADFITFVNTITTRKSQLYNSLKYLEINPIILKEKIISKYNVVMPDELLKETTAIHSIVRYLAKMQAM